MKLVNTYKALSYKLLVYGFHAPDLAIILILFLFVHGILNSLLIDILVMAPLLITARKAKNRPRGYFLSLIMFLIAPAVAPLGTGKDIPSYRSIINA